MKYYMVMALEMSLATGSGMINLDSLILSVLNFVLHVEDNT